MESREVWACGLHVFPPPPLPGLQCVPFHAPLPQVVGDAIQPHLSPLSASQLKLLTIYRDKAAGLGAAA